MTVLTSVPDVHVGAILALDILHHHEVVLQPGIFKSNIVTSCVQVGGKET